MFALLFAITALSTCFALPLIEPTTETAIGSISSPSLSHSSRTRFDIVWSCVSTLFICTWVAIHPNVPSRGEGSIRSLWRRLKLMLWTLVVPELILVWAFRQWSAAKYIGLLFKDEGWTATHGHFLIMGGFTFVDQDGVELVLDYESFMELVTTRLRRRGEAGIKKSTQIAFPTITVAEIQDKARGDFLSKAIVILQAFWFILQCIVRGVQGLALTELELVTLALASLNGVMYYLWWDKPLGVNEPVKIYANGAEPRKKIIDATRLLNINQRLQDHQAPQLTLTEKLQSLRSSLQQLFHDSPGSCHAKLSSMYRKLYATFQSFITKSLEQQNKTRESFPGGDYLWFLYLPIYWFLLIPVMSLASALVAVADTDSPKDGDATHIPTFYAPKEDCGYDVGILFSVLLPAIAVAFGGLHCIGWNFDFPTRTEQLLWRIGSLTITLLPSVPFVFWLLLPCGIILDVIYEACRSSLTIPRSVIICCHVIGYVLLGIGAVLAAAGLVAYMVARLLLLTEAIVLLRNQPESAFYAIDWTKFVPHL